MATIAPSPEVSSVILPSTSTLPNNDTTCGCDDTSMMMETDDNDAGPLSNGTDIPTRRVSQSTQGALDALAALAAGSTAVSSISEEPSHPQQHQQMMMITPHQTSSSDDDDSEIMPPPPPRDPTTMASTTSIVDMPAPSFTFLHDSTNFSNMGSNALLSLSRGVGGGRLRSASNPEGMEKWDLYSRRNDRQHFVLPSSILEEELASTRRVLGEVVDEEENDNAGERGIHRSIPQQPPPKEEETTPAFGFQQHWASGGVRRSQRTIDRLGTSPDSVSTDLGEDDPPSSMSSSKTKSNHKSNSSGSSGSNSKSKKKAAPPPEIISKSPPPDEEDEEDVDESTLEPEELLRRARSRLLEDLSEGGGGAVGGTGNGLTGDKGGVLILPHSLSKYKEVYNKNGRIGIYTPAERAAIIQKFNAKRARRVWNKKIRYNCRKNLADRRMRVKGRFVKRSVEAANSPPPPEDPTAVVGASEMPTNTKAKATVRSSSPPTSGSPLTTVNEHGEEQQQQPMDEDMPDVNDEEAGFDPSEDMPYRRTRRYTIT